MIWRTVAKKGGQGKSHVLLFAEDQTGSGTDRKCVRRCLDHILTRQSNCRRVSNVVVIPQPVRLVKPDSNHNMVMVTVILSGRTNPKQRQLDQRDVQVEEARWEVTQRCSATSASESN